MTSSSPNAFFFLPLSNIGDSVCVLLLQQCLTCVSGTSPQTRVERARERGKDICGCFFVIWMGSLFWEERQKKAEGSWGRGTTGNSQSPLPHIDWRQRRPLEYLLLSFVFCSFFSSSRCWEVLCLFICLLSRSSVFSSISPFTWSTISSIYEPDKEGERGRETEKKRKRKGTFFFICPPHPLFFLPLSFILPSLSIAITSSLFYPCAAHAPSSLHRLPPAPPPHHSTHCPPVTLATF